MLTYCQYHHHHHQVSSLHCQSKYNIMFFSLIHIYIYDIILHIVVSSLLNCSHKIWCICARMMLCDLDMCFLNISATELSVAIYHILKYHLDHHHHHHHHHHQVNSLYCYNKQDIIYFVVLFTNHSHLYI